jgi:hypothetical protein
MSATIEDSRLACSSAAHRLLRRFDCVERTVPRVLGVLNEVLPLASAVLIEGRAGKLRMLVWHAAEARPEWLLRAETNAHASYSFLTGPVPRSMEVERLTLAHLPEMPVRGAIPADAQPNFITAPLAIPCGAIFGALQVEGARRLDEDDLWLVHSLAETLSAAIDERHRRPFARQPGWRVTTTTSTVAGGVSGVPGAGFCSITQSRSTSP